MLSNLSTKSLILTDFKSYDNLRVGEADLLRSDDITQVQTGR